MRYAGFGSVSELAQLLRVSEMTVRRDMQNLAARHLLRQVHGGANAITDATEDDEFRVRSARGASAKHLIARAALEYLRPRTGIALDSGTTTLELARQLPSNLDLHVVTHSLPALTELSRREGIEVVSLGGALEAHTRSFVGPMTLSAIEGLRVDTFFLTCGAVREGSTYVGTPFDAEIKRALTDVCDRVVLLADSLKFSATSLFPAVSLERVDVVITDQQASPEVLDELRGLGADVVVTPLTSEEYAGGSPGQAADPESAANGSAPR